MRNYANLDFVRDPNSGFGRNSGENSEQAQQQEECGDNGFEHVDEDVKAICNEQSSRERAPPKRLTQRQQQIVQKLIDVHGKNTQAMMLDRKLNPMQHSEGALCKLIDSFRFWKKGSGVDFRTPKKGLSP